MPTCAWCKAPGKRATIHQSPYFSSESSHGVCPACAIKTLANRPRALKKFLVHHIDELEECLPPSGFYIDGKDEVEITSYRQLLSLL